MKRRKKNEEGESSLDLIERACHLLRRTPLAVWAVYYLGAVPFVLALLFFLADMSASPFANERCVGSALGLGLLYIWMRVWQSRFCHRLGDQLAQCDSRPLTAKQVLLQMVFHTVYSSWGIVLVPLSALMAVPFCWVFTYFNNLCAVNPFSGTVKEAAAKARALTMPWPKQNHILVSILTLFGIFVFLNFMIVLAVLPRLLKSLAGIESTFCQSYYWIANTTFLGVVAGLTYLAVDPLVKAAYVLRFHSAESITTGADLLADLNHLPPRRRTAGPARTVMILFLLLCAPFSKGQESAPQHSPVFQEAELDTAVERVIKRPEFTWRMPREFAPEEESTGFFARFIKSISQWLEKKALACRDVLERFFDWLAERFNPLRSKNRGRGNIDPALFRNLAILLLVLLAGVLIWYLINVFRARRTPPSDTEEARLACATVDMEDEALIASLLEEDEWIALARELAAAGELRKAMRAWFFAGLALLARTDLLVILHSKSNLDYLRELNRRARRCPSVIPVFGETIMQFERAWYGLHPVTTEDLAQLESSMERMRHGVET